MPVMLEDASLRDGPNGTKLGTVAHVGVAVTVKETQNDWVRITVDNSPDAGWVPKASVDLAAAAGAAAATPIDRRNFADSCVQQALIDGVNPHYLLGVAQLRSGITAGADGDRIGPYRLTATEWKEVTPPFLDRDIGSVNQQIGGFSLMVKKRMAAPGASPTPVQLYRAQWADAPADIADKLKAAFDATVDEEAAAEGRVLDQQADPDADPPVSSGNFGGTASGLPISQRAYDLIVSFEVSSEAVYNKRYRHPEWPGGQSGVTIGIGYDVGYCSAPQLSGDWNGQIDQAMIDQLQTVRGLKAQAAKTALATVQAVDVPWTSATTVHKKTVIPRWVGIVVKALPNTDKLSPDSLGALVSLTYNRGASYDLAGDRYAEMRGIKAAMVAQNFAAIPDLIRQMKRLWPDVPGLLIRRDKEADLFASGLAATAGT